MKINNLKTHLKEKYNIDYNQNDYSNYNSCKIYEFNQTYLEKDIILLKIKNDYSELINKDVFRNLDTFIFSKVSNKIEVSSESNIHFKDFNDVIIIISIDEGDGFYCDSDDNKRSKMTYYF